MEGTVLLGVRVVPTQYKSVKIENVNLETKVDVFKEEAAKKIDHPKECIGGLKSPFYVRWLMV